QEAERSARAVVEDRGRTGLLADGEEAVRDEAERLVPRGRLEPPAHPDERRRQAVGRVLRRRVLRRALAEEALRDGMLRIAPESDELPVLDGGDEAAGVGAIAVTDGTERLDRHQEDCRKSVD